MMAMPRGLLIVRALVVITLISVPAGVAAAAGKAPSKKTPVAVEPPMRVYIVRSAQDGCEPNCPEWVAAQGRIEPGSLGRFKKVLSETGKRNLPVLIHSGGGLADEALAIGRLLRSKGIDVGVAKTTFTPCAPEAAACRKKEAKKPLRGVPDAGFSVCASSCAFILAGGARRFVGAPAFVGVHRGAMIQKKVLQTFKMTPYRARDGSIKYKRKLIKEKVISQRQTRAPDKTYDKYEKYFVEMGIGKDIMPLLLATPNASIHWLTQEELRSTRIATHRVDAEQLVLGATAAEDGWADPAVTGAVVETPPPATDCTQFGGSPLGCSWQFTPGASFDGSGAVSDPPQ
jgi:hypothetical protein